MFCVIGPCKGSPGILDSNFKQTRDSGFKLKKGKILDSDFKMSRILDSNFNPWPWSFSFGLPRIQRRFQISNFKAIFLDSYFNMAWILDSNRCDSGFRFGLTGPLLFYGGLGSFDETGLGFT